jgi:predicted nucleic acid-binding Zn ribbon protein
MEQICIYCGNVFQGTNEKICSEDCRNFHVLVIKKRIRDAMDDDPNHTTRFSRD